MNDPADDLRRVIAGSASTVPAGVARGVPLATAMVGRDGHRGRVRCPAVTPARQGRGLGRRVMRACERWVRAGRVSKLQPMVRGGDRAVIAFHERLGCVDAGVVVLGRRLGETVP